MVFIKNSYLILRQEEKMKRSWGESYIVLKNGHRIFLETPYEQLKKVVEDKEECIRVHLANWYGNGTMEISYRDIAEIGIPN